MQYAFSYFYYMVDQKIQKTPGQIFDEFDTDKTG